jgi:hypothetical protein
MHWEKLTAVAQHSVSRPFHGESEYRKRGS